MNKGREKSGAFGFQQSDEQLRALAQTIQTHQPGARSDRPNQDDVDRISNEIGFGSRQPLEYVRRTRAPAEPTQQLAMRLPISLVARFAKYADEEGLSYPKALARLLDKQGA